MEKNNIFKILLYNKMIEYILGLTILTSVMFYLKTHIFSDKTLVIQTIFIDKNGNVDESKTVEKLFINNNKCALNEWQSYENYCDELLREISNNLEKYKNYDAVIIKNKLNKEELLIYSLFGHVYLDKNLIV